MHGIQYHRLLSRVVNTPLLSTEQRALTVLSLLAPRAGLGADLRVAMGEADDSGGAKGPLMLSDFAAAVPRLDGPREERKAYRVVEGVAVIPVEGDLVNKLGTLDPWCGMTGYDSIIFKADEAEADPAVRGVAFEYNTPGGEALGCEVCGEVLSRISKPTRSFIWEAYSAGCWLSSQADRVVITRLGGTGSVGVVNLHVDYSQQLAQDGLTVTVLRAGQHKAEGDPFGPLAEDTCQRFIAEMEGMRRVFAAAVAEGRGIDIEAILATEARTFGADAALALGFVDEIMSPDDALAQFIADLDADASGRKVFIPAAQAANLTKPAAQAAISEKGAPMATKPQTGRAGLAAARQHLNAKPKAADETKPEDKDEDKAAKAAEDEDTGDGDDDEEEGREDQPKAASPPPPPAEDEENEEDKEEKPKEGASAKAAAGAKARIKAILTAPAAKASPNLAQKLAFETDTDAKAAIAIMEAAQADSQTAAKSGPAKAFAAAMAGHAGPPLGDGGGGDRANSGKTALKAARQYQEKHSHRR